MGLHHIRLERAPDAEAPHGGLRDDPPDGYDLVLALDDQARLDAPALIAEPDRTRVRRFRDGETLAIGRMTRGADHQWVLDFPGAEFDAVGLRRDDARFVVGACVSLADARGRVRPYRVVVAHPLSRD